MEANQKKFQEHELETKSKFDAEIKRLTKEVEEKEAREEEKSRNIKDRFIHAFISFFKKPTVTPSPTNFFNSRLALF